MSLESLPDRSDCEDNSISSGIDDNIESQLNEREVSLPVRPSEFHHQRPPNPLGKRHVQRHQLEEKLLHLLQGIRAKEDQYRQGDSIPDPVDDVLTEAEASERSVLDPTLDRYYPRDSYSFLSLNGPCMSGGKLWWSVEKARLFIFGLLPFLFQMTFFVLLFVHFKAETETHTTECSEETSTDDASGIVTIVTTCTTVGGYSGGATATPSGVDDNDNVHTGMNFEDPRIDIVIAQIASLLAYMLYPNSSQQDVVRAIQMFPWRPPSPPPPSDKDETSGGGGVVAVPVGCIRLSCLLRGIQSHCAISVVFLLVMTCDSTLEIILNLTAANFISELDTKAFQLALSGVFGPSLEQEAKRIAREELPACSYSGSKHFCYGMILVVYALIFGGYGLLIVIGDDLTYLWMTEHTIMMVLSVVGFILVVVIANSVYNACRTGDNGPGRRRTEKAAGHHRGYNENHPSDIEDSTRTHSTVEMRRTSMDFHTDLEGVQEVEVFREMMVVAAADPEDPAADRGEGDKNKNNGDSGDGFTRTRATVPMVVRRASPTTDLYTLRTTMEE